jgi:hypothetical protein
MLATRRKHVRADLTAALHRGSTLITGLLACVLKVQHSLELILCPGTLFSPGPTRVLPRAFYSCISMLQISDALRVLTKMGSAPIATRIGKMTRTHTWSTSNWDCGHHPVGTDMTGTVAPSTMAPSEDPEHADSEAQTRSGAYNDVIKFYHLLCQMPPAIGAHRSQVSGPSFTFPRQQNQGLPIYTQHVLQV